VRRENVVALKRGLKSKKVSIKQSNDSFSAQWASHRLTHLSIESKSLSVGGIRQKMFTTHAARNLS
jgi:hypothetical protein